MGGDESCVLAPLALGNPLATLERGRRGLGEAGDGFEISAAYGCVLVPEEADSAGAALGIADRRMTSERPYGRSLTSGEAIAELRRCAGTQFDPQVVRAFCRVSARVTADAAE